MVEFALILFPLLIIIAGIIQFGIGLNYWLDLNRVANQGARWASVNSWPPDCPRESSLPCTNTPACTAATRTRTTLQNSMSCQLLTGGLRRATTIKVCYPNVTELAGDPVMIEVKAPFKIVPLVGLGTINLQAAATMRLERRPTLVTGETTYNTVTKRCN
jgi:hypothetical protein